MPWPRSVNFSLEPENRPLDWPFQRIEQAVAVEHQEAEGGDDEDQDQGGQLAARRAVRRYDCAASSGRLAASCLHHLPLRLAAGQRPLVLVQRFGHPAGAARHAGQRVFGGVDRHPQLGLEPALQAEQ